MAMGRFQAYFVEYENQTESSGQLDQDRAGRYDADRLDGMHRRRG